MIKYRLLELGEGECQVFLAENVICNCSAIVEVIYSDDSTTYMCEACYNTVKTDDRPTIAALRGLPTTHSGLLRMAINDLKAATPVKQGDDWFNREKFNKSILVLEGYISELEKNGQ